ncbi:MAG: DUF2237 domain-containing protein [Myxococcota bacterium]
MSEKKSLNVLGQPLEPCSMEPKTGWFRDGSCRTDAQDRGVHVVCAKVTQEFLEFSKARGNDLMTPRPEYAFPGLKPGDCWCLCAQRFAEAAEAGVGPGVKLRSTEQGALRHVGLEVLTEHSVD